MSALSPYVSQSELGRLANIPHTRIIALIKSGKIQPDLIIGRVHAFTRSRINEVQAMFGTKTNAAQL